MKRPIEGGKREQERWRGELNREMKMALLLYKRTTERENPMVAASKKEMNDTVIQLRNKDGHNSTVRSSSVSLSDNFTWST